jgi:aconitate hydratase
MLLGVRAVLAESYERIHRANLVGMGILPLSCRPARRSESLGLSGHETFEITGLEGAGADAFPREVTVRADDQELTCRVRIDTPTRSSTTATAASSVSLRQLRG